MYRPTERVFTDKVSGEKFRLHMDSETHNYSLISDGSENLAAGTTVNGFYLCPFDSVEVKIRNTETNKTKIVSLGMGEFYNLEPEEEYTHRKFAGFKRFQKINL